MQWFVPESVEELGEWFGIADEVVAEGQDGETGAGKDARVDVAKDGVVGTSGGGERGHIGYSQVVHDAHLGDDEKDGPEENGTSEPGLEGEMTPRSLDKEEATEAANPRGDEETLKGHCTSRFDPTLFRTA